MSGDGKRGGGARVARTRARESGESISRRPRLLPRRRRRARHAGGFIRKYVVEQAVGAEDDDVARADRDGEGVRVGWGIRGSAGRSQLVRKVEAVLLLGERKARVPARATTKPESPRLAATRVDRRSPVSATTQAVDDPGTLVPAWAAVRIAPGSGSVSGEAAAAASAAAAARDMRVLA